MVVVLIARLIFQLNVSPMVKREISHCTFYGVIAGTVNLWDRYEACKKKIIKY